MLVVKEIRLAASGTFYSLLGVAMLLCVGRGEHVGLSVCCLFGNTVPDGVNHVFVIQTFIDAITADQKVVKIVFQLECCDFWLTDNNIWVSSVTGLLCFDVTESSRD